MSAFHFSGKEIESGGLRWLALSHGCYSIVKQEKSRVKERKRTEENKNLKTIT